jgi:hypothetical protein
LRPISLVVAVCSSTAEAMVVWMSLIWAMTWVISPMASVAARASVWMAVTLPAMSSVASAGC